MIEINMFYDLLPGVDQKVYLEWARRAIGITLKQPGLIELSSHLRLYGTPTIRATTRWQSLVDWARYAEGAWLPLEAELQIITTNQRNEFWGASPVIPEPLRPAK